MIADRPVPLPQPLPAHPAEPRRTVLVQRGPTLEPPTCPLPGSSAPALHLVAAPPFVVPDPPRRRPLPDVDPAARVGAARTLRLALEVEGGRRSPGHLAPLVTPTVLAGVLARARLRVRGREHPAHLHVVHVQAVTEHVVEAFSRVSRGPRDHAVTARLERSPDGWRCTALRLR